MTDKANIIKSICASLSSGDLSNASEIGCQQYPFSIQEISTRKFTDAQALQIFIRDGFIDRPLSEGVQNFYNGDCCEVIIEENKNLDEVINLLVDIQK